LILGLVEMIAPEIQIWIRVVLGTKTFSNASYEEKRLKKMGPHLAT
jgi:hypothetical protein